MVFTALAFGLFFISLYAAIPLVFFRCLLPYRRVEKPSWLSTVQYLGSVSFLIYLGATGTINHLLEALWSHDFAWILGIALIFCYITILAQDYRFFSKLTAEEVAQFYRKRLG